MAFTEIARLSATTTRTTSITATNTYTLPSAPTSGQWIVVALYTNQGSIPAVLGITGQNNWVSAVSCGSISLNVLEGALQAPTGTPTVFIAPYQSGMTTTISVTWLNGIAATIIGVAAMVFSGAVTGASSGYDRFRTSGANGAFDGSGDNSAGYGLTQALASSGIISWASSSTGIPTNYDTQGQIFIAASSATQSFNVNQPRQFGLFGAGVDASGNVTTLGQATGTVLINSVTTVVTSGKGVIYSPSGNFVFTYTGTNTTFNTLTGCTTTAPSSASIPGYCQLMLANNGTSTITAVLPTNSLTSGTLGGFQTGNTTAYSGASTANGHVQTAITTGATPARLDLMLGSNVVGTTSVKAYANMKISGSNTPVGGGIIYTMVPPTRTMTRLSVASRTLIARVVKVRNKIVLATFVRTPVVSRQVASVRTAKATLIRTPKALRVVIALRTSVANALRIPLLIKTRASQRVSAASQVNVASVTRTRKSVRRANVSVTYTIASTKRRTFVRRAVATAVGTARVLKQIVVRPRAGTVTGDFKIAGGRASFQTGQLEGTFDTANVVGSQKKTGQI